MNYKTILIFFNLSLLAMTPEGTPDMTPEEIVTALFASGQVPDDLMTPEEAAELFRQFQEGTIPNEEELLTAYKAHAQHNKNLERTKAQQNRETYTDGIGKYAGQ